MTWLPACNLEELVIGTPRGVHVAHVGICLVRASDGIFALRDECTHGAVPLSDGDVDGCTIECWMHGSRFDLRTGAVLNLPATEPVSTFPVRLLDGIVQVDIP